MSNKLFTIGCICGSPEHNFLFRYFPDDKELYLITFLEPHYSFWKRVWVAIKYAFGYKSEYGHFSETIIEENDIQRLKNFLSNKGLENHDNSEESRRESCRKLILAMPATGLTAVEESILQIFDHHIRAS